MNNPKHSPQRQREYALYRYHKALERGDFETTSAILKQAEHDPQLNQMIAELDNALESESEAQTRPADTPLISLPSSQNGQPPKPNHFQEQTDMTTQPRYWEPQKSIGRPNRFAAALVILIAALVVAGVFLFMIPSRSSIMTMFIQQPTPTAAEIAQLYVNEIWGKDDEGLMKTLFVAGFVDHDPMFVNNGHTVLADKNNLPVFSNNVLILHRAFPDLTVKTETVIETSDRLVVRWTFTGTFILPFLDYAATNKKVTMTSTDILGIKDGKIVERWGENRLQALLDASEILTVSQPSVDAVTAFARFAYIFSADKVDDLGDAFIDPVTFNGVPMSLKDFKTTVADVWTQSGGITKIKMKSATVFGNHVTAKVEFYTDNGTTLNQGIVLLTITDGKISSYDFSATSS